MTRRPTTPMAAIPRKASQGCFRAGPISPNMAFSIQGETLAGQCDRNETSYAQRRVARGRSDPPPRKIARAEAWTSGRNLLHDRIRKRGPIMKLFLAAAAAAVL